MINRMLCGLAALIGAMALTLGVAGTASAEEAGHYPEWEPELSVTLADCQVTVQANSIPYNVSSGTRTAGLAIRVNGETVATPPKEMENGPHTFNESLSFGPVVDGDLVEFRWFAGPVRNDLPTWNTVDHPDWIDTVVERESTEGRHWDARDSAPFVTWYTFEVTGCPASSTDPTTPPASPSPDPSASPDPTGDQLPVTSGVRTLPILLISGFALIGAGAGIYYATRRKMNPTL